VSAGSERVLEALRRRPGQPCSGALLSESLGVTRSQVWKHVETLRRRGYAIEGTPGDGYTLAALPDRLYPEELRSGLATRWLAREIHWFEETDSTNRVAGDLARAGASHGTTVVAEGQTAGRGRLGRRFFSPPHRNLYTSIVLRPRLGLAEAPLVILAAATAVAESVAAWAGTETVSIKWPNDVQIRGLKTSGILMELHAEATRVGFLVLGIGVNLNADPAGFPEEFRARATSLAAQTGAAVERAAFARHLYGTLEDVLDAHADRGLDGFRERFEPFFRMAGARVRVADAEGRETAGRVLGVAPDGSLRLRDDAGREHRVVAGDVTVAKEDA
jgi:BirA family biotin operon repressor/biotin-[acetyl-CoA-carboxylase] ligase